MLEILELIESGEFIGLMIKLDRTRPASDGQHEELRSVNSPEREVTGNYGGETLVTDGNRGRVENSQCQKPS